MTDLERKLEEIAEKFYTSDCQCDECIRELVQATTEATARYCAEIAKREGDTPKEEGGTLSRWDACDNVRAAILRECGVKE